jgi:hypothetical protein
MLRPRHSSLRIGFIVLWVTFGATLKMEAAAPKTHVISFGKWTTVLWHTDTNSDEKPFAVKVRALTVDGRVKEFTVGGVHEITDRLFVVQRMFRVNDRLPQEPDLVPQWQWERGGWILVDRTTGRVAAINLPEFDTGYSAASWYRDYVGYCGISDDGKKIYAVVAQIGRRKPVLRKMLIAGNGAETNVKEAPDSACSPPVWQRAPTRVTFEPAAAAKQTFAIRGHVADILEDSEDEEEGTK